MTAEHSNPHPQSWQLSEKHHRDAYSLALVIRGGGTADMERLLLLGGGGLRATEFVFTVNPKNMELVEPMATVIRPTQGGGQFIESQGQIYKDVRIAGTTGFRPNKVITAVIDPATGLPAGERTGFDDLIDLRNLWRTYGMAKVDQSLAHLVVMVWKNGKDGDYFIVEPITFKTVRDASSPLTATYDIQLRTISRYDVSLADLVVDTHALRNSNNSLRAFLNKTTFDLQLSLSNLIGDVDASINQYAKLLTSIVTPANEVLSAIVALSSTRNRVLEVTEFAVGQLAGNLLDAKRAINYTQSGRRIRQALTVMHRAIVRLQVRTELFSPPISASLRSRRGSYSAGDRTFTNSGGDLLDLANNSVSGSMASAVIGPNDTIRKLAKKLLGSSAKWKSLVIANDLKAPYISTDGDGIDVLRPGDTVLYPTGETSTASSIATGSYTSAVTSPLEERLGRDLQLVAVQSIGGVQLFDLVTSDSHDLATVQGIPNLEQGIGLKFETEQGDLPLHPFYGIKFPIGAKAPSSSGFVAFNVDARSTLLSDPRVSTIQKLDVNFTGNSLNVKVAVGIKGFDSSLAFTFSTKK
ncbi:MAG: hypothetical protein L3J47_00415 [Sulfurovum sp.]|nr:hypothetical protein [Sulfurovum sp.]